MKDETWKHLSYNFRVNGKTKADDIKTFIEKVIARLQAKGFSNRDIHDITHFSRKKIKELSPAIPKEPSESYSLQQFLEDKLVVSDEVLEKILDNGVLSDIEKIEFVTETLRYGCTYSCIAKIMGISKGSIAKVAKSLYHDRIGIEISKLKRKIVIVDDGIEKRVFIRTREKKNSYIIPPCS